MGSFALVTSSRIVLHIIWSPNLEQEPQAFLIEQVIYFLVLLVDLMLSNSILFLLISEVVRLHIIWSRDLTEAI